MNDKPTLGSSLSEHRWHLAGRICAWHTAAKQIPEIASITLTLRTVGRGQSTPKPGCGCRSNPQSRSQRHYGALTAEVWSLVLLGNMGKLLLLRAQVAC
jgi:hypothetical protein